MEYSIQELENADSIQSIITTFKNKLTGLQKQEEDFNQNVQVVIESDEQQMKLNEMIISLKKEIESILSLLELS
jgi:hypothetical protein